MCDELGLGGDVDAVHVGVPYWRGRRRQVHLSYHMIRYDTHDTRTAQDAARQGTARQGTAW